MQTSTSPLAIALPGLGAGVAVSAVAFSGVFVHWLTPSQLERLVPSLVGLAVGVLLGDAFIHLIPDAVARHGDVGEVCLAVLGGCFYSSHWKSWCAGGMTTLSAMAGVPPPFSRWRE